MWDSNVDLFDFEPPNGMDLLFRLTVFAKFLLNVSYGNYGRKVRMSLNLKLGYKWFELEFILIPKVGLDPFFRHIFRHFYKFHKSVKRKVLRF